MSGKLSSLSSVVLSEAFAQNFIAYFKHLAAPEHEENKIKIKAEDTSSLISVGLNLPIFNGIFLREDSNYEKIISSFDPYYLENTLPYQIWLDSELDKNEYIPKLKSHGFRYIGDDNALAMEIEKMKKEISFPNSLYVEEVNSQERFEKYVDLVKLKFNYRGDSYKEYLKKFESIDFKNKPTYWRKYIGWLNGEAKSAATLILAGGIAVIYEEALTAKLARNPYGVNDGTVSKLMKDSLKMGYKIGGVFSSVGELRRYFALGFTEQFKVPKFIRILPRKPRNR
ncbi:MAG: hypothetical protein HeimC2_25300 [Candidatus Heimdallarchaeota archaeon LC_2]|nr:MAG: hypothetical protein HeimC2_25300 [Candidatus Heimdallarchaeota archaeon LC_2]